MSICHLHTEMPSSGLWENIKLNKNKIIATYPRWHQLHIMYTGAEGGKGGELLPTGEL